MTGPLAGVRVLDMTSVLMGPYATSIMGDMGADVIKLESPDGDLIRQVGPSRSGAMGGMFMHANRSKRSIAVDLKRPGGRDVALKLAQTADVLVYNIRPQAMERLGLGYEDVAKVRPDIIYVGTFGFGQDGPYAAKPAYDDLVQGLCAVPSLIAEAGDGTPRYVPINIADRVVGLHALSAILAALRHRDRTGQGQRIDVPMLETMASFVLGDHLGGLSYEPQLDEGGYPRLLAPERRPFRTADGFLCVVIYTDRHWQRFIEITGRADWRDDIRLASHASRTRHAGEIMKSVAEIFAGRTTAAWEDALAAADIPHARMHTLSSLLKDPHLAEAGFFQMSEHPTEGPVRTMRVPSRWSVSQPQPTRPAPELGEHSRELLRELHLPEKEIERLLSTRSVICHGDRPDAA
ncbi:acetyl-CoA acetyltransferase [Bosea sp. Root483D1]|uniref:CaiB/BaiF CoA transferase family protein n=1 Tax=Bosea sp. Root483D1 TaxID=1736544 RepID=UPI000709952D|nr:CoA transferase [Bosea sp. Root483D1]KRE11624.1 acetyl-CoA acetyltransferase [Bosea sp. Root483D1]